RAAVEVAGIANVATAQPQRGRGLATALLTNTVSLLAERDFGFSALLPYSYGFYRPLGWELATTQRRLRVPRCALPSFSESRQVRKALSSDLEEMESLHAEQTRFQTGRCLRGSA